MSCVASHCEIADDTDTVHCNIHHDVIIHDEIVAVVNCTDCLPNDTIQCNSDTMALVVCSHTHSYSHIDITIVPRVTHLWFIEIFQIIDRRVLLIKSQFIIAYSIAEHQATKASHESILHRSSLSSHSIVACLAVSVHCQAAWIWCEINVYWRAVEWSHTTSRATQAPTHTRQRAYHKASARSRTASL